METIKKPSLEIYKEKNHFLVTVEDGNTIKIPSQMFPLKGMPEFFNPDNTEELEDDEVREIFDSIEFELGKCYFNTQAIMTSLRENGIKGAEAYAGWTLAPSGYPVHHTFVLYKRKHILDPSASLRFKDMKHLANITGEDMKEAVANLYIERQKLSNSERCVFGKASDLYFYIGSRQEPLEALKVIKKIIQTYPNHPSYRNTDKQGYNQTVKRIYEKMGNPIK